MHRFGPFTNWAINSFGIDGNAVCPSGDVLGLRGYMLCLTHKIYDRPPTFVWAGNSGRSRLPRHIKEAALKKVKRCL
jgi:hypothetical protein